MKFFFVQDYRHKYRYFSSEPIQEIHVKFSRLEKIWEEAKKKLMLLPQRILAQEQAFKRVLSFQESYIPILYSGRQSEKRIKIKFFFFLQKQRTKHIFLLIAETLLLPVSGLAALLPGPNVFFGILALLIITHWHAIKGIHSLLKKEHQFIPASSLREWEAAIKSRKGRNFPLILDKIGKEYELQNIQKILWK